MKPNPTEEMMTERPLYSACMRSSARSIVHLFAAFLLLAVAMPALAQLQFTPSSHDFGEVALGTTAGPQAVTLTNTGAGRQRNLQFSLGGDGSFGMTEDCPYILNAGASCQVFVTFAPHELGSATAVLTVTSTSATATLNLAGNCTRGLLFDPPGLRLQTTEVGSTSPPQTTILRLFGDLAVTDLSFTDPSDSFDIDTSACGDSLPVGGSCEVSVTYSPITPSSVDATVTVANDQDIPAALRLGGCFLREAAGTEPYETVLLSRACGADGAKGDGNSTSGSASSDGRYFVFSSAATNLHPDDTGFQDVFVRDLQTDDVVLVSRASGADGVEGNSYSQDPSISADGRYVAFLSLASNLHPDDADAVRDVFVRDLQTDETFLVSRAAGADGASGDGASSNPSISADGRYAAFRSTAANLHPDDTDDDYDVFVRDLVTQEMVLASRATGAGGSKGNGGSLSPRISADGRFVAFYSRATNLHPDDTDEDDDVFARDLQTDETILVSRASGVDGAKGDNVSHSPSLSTDGRFIAFQSAALNLHPDDDNDDPDIYVRDLQTHDTTLVSRASGVDGNVGENDSSQASISADGRYVAFSSSATNLHPGDVDSFWDIYLRDRTAHETILLSRASGADGAKGNANSFAASISGDGRYVIFYSGADNLHPDDLDTINDVFVRDVMGPAAQAGLVFLPADLDFGDVEVDTTSAPLIATLENSGDVEITGLSFSPLGHEFDADTSACGASLPIGESCEISVTFTPSGVGPFEAMLTVSSDQDTSATLDLVGEGAGSPGAELSFAPASLDFGDVEVGQTSPPQTATLQNTGTGAANGLTFTVPNAFTADTSACGTGLGAGESCDVVVTFTSFAPGAVAIELQVASVEGASTALDLTGNGVPPPAGPALSFNPESLAFGGVLVGTTSAPLIATLENAGDGDATGLAFTTPGNGFTADTGACGTSLPAGQSCSVTVTFTPGGMGGSAGTLEVESAEGATATLGAPAPPAKYLYLGSIGSAFRMDPSDLRSGRFVFTPSPQNRAWGPTGVVVDPQRCAYYWDDPVTISGNHRLLRSNMDGTEEEVLLDLGPGRVTDLELDVNAGALYYTMSANVFRGDIGPAGLTNVEHLVTIPGGSNPSLRGSHLALDVEAGRMYATGGVSGIWSAELDGTDLQLVLDTAGEPPPRGLALDLQAGKIYWGDGESTGSGELRIHRASLDGTQYEVVLVSPTSPPPARFDSIVVDPALGKIIWSDSGGFYSADLDGSAIDHTGAPGFGFDSMGFNFVPGNIDALCGTPPADECPPGAACDRVEQIYWIGGNSAGGELWRAREDGSYREMLYGWDGGSPGSLAVSRELGKVYWSMLDPASVWRANLDGTDVEPVLELPFTPQSGQYPLGIDLDLATNKMFVSQRNRDGFATGVDQTKATLWMANLDGSELEVRAVFTVVETSDGRIGGPRIDKRTRLGYVGVDDGIHRFDLDSMIAPEVVLPSLPQHLYPEGAVALDDHATALQLDRLQGRLYWRQLFSHQSVGRVGRNYQVDLDGTNVQVLPWSDDSSFYQRNRIGLAIDVHSRRMYGTGIDHLAVGHLGLAMSRWEIEDGEDLYISYGRGSHSVGSIALLPAVAGGTWATLSLIGMGMVPGLAASPDPLDFGAVPIGDASAPGSVTLTSTGGLPVEVTGIAAPTAPFTHTGGDCPAAPFALDPGASCTLEYVFAPAALGLFEQTLAVGSDAGPETFTLAGEGVPVPPQIDVDPESLVTTLETGDTETRPLILANLGDRALEWAVTDGSRGRVLRPSGRATVPEMPLAPTTVKGLARATAAGNGRTPTANPLPVPLGDQVTLTHSTSSDVEALNTVACSADGGTTTTDNSFLRTFALADFGITGDFDVTEVTFGIENLTVTASITVNLYTLEGPFTYANLSLIGSAVEELTSQQQTLMTVPVTGTAPAGSTLVVEISAPNLSGVGAFFAGSNSLGETAPSYLAAAGCGAPDPVSYAGIGFPGVHLVMTVAGSTEPPVDCDLPDWAGVDPTTGSVPGGDDQTVNVTFDAGGLVPGDYAANLCFASNDPANPLVAVPLTLSVLEVAHGIVVTPVTHDFGTVPVGDSAAPVTITIESTGTDDLQVDSVGEPGSAFARVGGSCEPAPFALQPGTSCTLDYGFTPQSEGAFTGIATIASNADPAVIGVALTGEGEGEPPDELFRDSFEDDAP